MASSSDPPDMKDIFENDYERQWVLKRSAQVAGCLIHDHMDKDDRERVARLAGDVGRKLRDFLVKRPDRGFLYQACLHGDLSQVGLAMLLAFRSQFRSAAEIPADVNIYFDQHAPLGCHDFDKYLSKRFARWEENEDAAVGFQEPTAVEHTYWGRDFTEKMRPGAVVEEIIDFNGLDARDYFDTNKPITRGDVLQFVYYCKVHTRERIIKALEDFAEGREKFRKEILYTSSGFPIISEPDQVDIVCAFCDDSLPVSSLDQLRSHCRKRGHTFATALSILGRQG
ncbi:hypothetical protein CkaCkLH20_04736 [Colletotrichum karsti]|uniref:Uncharacterized protein n=1 Tax=Colletotrichum karsti TaxID=1095194 RepID=A0A9P6I9G0_9PEZI|nr:uncharacterized protein CkaCkLH20_04736 [Colletotrichum karsti]KAF9877601.1 hypothetical protein CkaCkLH20_04736 [Colletotrichum karsti]